MCNRLHTTITTHNMIQLRENTKTVVVICAFAQYKAPGSSNYVQTQLPELKEIGPAVLRLQALFSSERYQSAGVEVIPPLQYAGSSEVKAHLAEIREVVRHRPGTNLVLFWSGHGGLDTGSFRLATPDTLGPIEQEDGLGLDEISREAGIARVTTWTLFLDACHAGAGFEDAVTAVNRQVMGEAGKLRGFGSMCSSAPFDRARDSVFLNKLIDVLANGPSTAAQAHLEVQGRQSKFSPNDRLLEMPHIFKVLNAEYQVDPVNFRNATLPMSVYIGDYALFPNPFYDKNQPSRLVEDIYRTIARPSDLESHFFPKAIGIDNLETGWHFTGRVDATRKILDWIKQPSTNASGSLYVLAADGGTGKSALLGRLIALTDVGYRKKAAEQGWNEEADRKVGTVPDIDQIDAALNLRNLTAQSAADSLADILKIPKTDSVEKFVKSARDVYAKAANTSPCVVLDALDEAEDPSALISRIIRPLTADGWKVLVATRQSAQTRGAGDLLAALGKATHYRLDQDAQSHEDIYHYAYGRLMHDKARANVAEPAAQIIADRAENKFLFARMSTSSLLRSTAEVTPDTLDRFIAKNAAAALEKDVAEFDLAFQQKFDRSDLGATAMLTALAWTQGEGVPIRDGIWPAMANAVSPVDEAINNFESTHILWLLREAGRYIQEAGDGEQAVYRLFHKSLVEHFLKRRVPDRALLEQETRLAKSLSLCARGSKDWRFTNPYLIRHMPAHLVSRSLQSSLNKLLTNFDWVQARLNQSGIYALLNDYTYCENASPATARLHRTLSMVSHILRAHPEQLIPQMLGRIAWNSNATHEPLYTFIQRALALIKGEILVPWVGGLEQAGALLRVLDHRGHVTSVAFGLGGKTIVSGSRDNIVRIWDLQTGALLRTLLGHESWITSLAVSSDGSIIVSGSRDRTVRVWDGLSGAALYVLRGHSESVTCVAVSSNCKTVVSGGQDNSVRTWSDGDALQVLQGHEDWITSVAISADGKAIVSGSQDNTVRVWDAHVGTPLPCPRRYDSCVTCVAVSPDSKTIMSGSRDNCISVWDMHTGAALRTLRGHDDWVTSLAASPDGKTIVSGSRDNSVRVWDAQTGVSLSVLHGHTASVSSVAISQDNKSIISGSDDKAVRTWDAQASGAVRPLHEHRNTISGVAVSADGNTIVTCSHDNSIKAWFSHNGIFRCGSQDQKDFVNCVAMSLDGMIVSGNRDRTVQVWTTLSEKPLHVLRGHEASVNSVAISSNCKTIVSGGQDNTVRIWDFATGAALRVMQGHKDWVTSVAISSDNKTIVSGSFDNDVRVWDAHTGAATRTQRGHNNQVTCVAICPEGKTIISGSRDKTIRIWDAQTGAALRTLRGHYDWVTSIAVSPDGKTILSGCIDKTVRVWDLHTGAVLVSLNLDASVHSIAYAFIGGLPGWVVASGERFIILAHLGRTHAIPLQSLPTNL
jgi:WD40 repeat protein